MDKKITFSIIVLVGVILIAGVLMTKVDQTSSPEVATNNTPPVSSETTVKEFSMTSFTDMSGGSFKPQFSLKEITVNKGDRVRIKITGISGMHDFKIDEFGVFADTPINKEVVVEFTADKAGEFIYYCAKPRHRESGQWGTLKVLDT